MFIMIVDAKITAQALCFKKMEDGRYNIFKGMFFPNQQFQEAESGRKWDTGGIEKLSIPAAKMAALYSSVESPEQMTLDDYDDHDDYDIDIKDESGMNGVDVTALTDDEYIGVAKTFLDNNNKIMALVMEHHILDSDESEFADYQNWITSNSNLLPFLVEDPKELSPIYSSEEEQNKVVDYLNSVEPVIKTKLARIYTDKINIVNSRLGEIQKDKESADFDQAIALELEEKSLNEQLFEYQGQLLVNTDINDLDEEPYKIAWMMKHRQIDVRFKVPVDHGMRLANEVDCKNCNMDNQVHVMIENPEGSNNYEKFCLLDCHSKGYADISLIDEGCGGLEVIPKEPLNDVYSPDPETDDETVTADVLDVLDDQEKTSDDLITDELAGCYFRYFEILGEIETKYDGFAPKEIRDAQTAEIRKLLGEMVTDYVPGQNVINPLEFANEILDYAEFNNSESFRIKHIADFLNAKFKESKELKRAMELYNLSLSNEKLQENA